MTMLKRFGAEIYIGLVVVAIVGLWGLLIFAFDVAAQASKP